MRFTRRRRRRSPQKKSTSPRTRVARTRTVLMGTKAAQDLAKAARVEAGYQVQLATRAGPTGLTKAHLRAITKLEAEASKARAHLDDRMIGEIIEGEKRAVFAEAASKGHRLLPPRSPPARTIVQHRVWGGPHGRALNTPARRRASGNRTRKKPSLKVNTKAPRIAMWDAAERYNPGAASTRQKPARQRSSPRLRRLGWSRTPSA